MITNSLEIWYSLKKEELEKRFKSNLEKGLTLRKVSNNSKKYGFNIINKKKKITFISKVFSHIKSPLNLILIIAGIVALVLSSFLDATVVFLAVFINLTVGIFQEDKADKAFENLNKAQEKTATVIREGLQKIIPIQNLTKGDLVVLNAGVYVPADIRLIQSKNLQVNEAILTGEWIDVEKNSKIIKKENLSISDQKNMLWMGTSVSAGYGLGLVTAIGNETELGKISQNLTNYERVTPMKRKMDRLIRFLTITVLFATVLIFFLGIFKGESYVDMFLVAIAVAIAVIPEGLPIATTAVLAVGMKQILKKGGLVKNLLASETLGNVSIILTDKTGTITEAKMKLADLITINKNDKNEALKMAVIGSDAFVEKDENEKLVVQGRPIEKAIITKGLEKGISQEELETENARLDLLLFSSKNGYSASLNKSSEKENILYINGRPDILLEKSTYIFENGKKRKITKKEKTHFKKILTEKTNLGLRLTGQAYKKVSWDKINKEITKDLVFVGLIVFEDPIRKDVKESLLITKRLGVRTIMVTGDNQGTARKIAEEVGICKKGDPVLTGSEVEKMNDDELEKALRKINVFARMNPNQKLRVSRELKRMGEIIAMTGDGINDAPALRNADVGMAVESGTEVAKESADLVLLDNSFSVIVFAVEEGRRIIDNLKKITAYLLSTSFSEVFVVAGALLFGLPLPVLASQILWINIVEEGFMNFAFVFEPGEKDLMERDPRSQRTRNILTGPLKQMILIVSFVTGVFLLALFWFLNQFNLSIEEIRTIMFVALSIDSIFFACF